MSSNHVLNHPKLKNMSSIVDLYQGLVETEKSIIYPLVDKLIQFILTLPVSTITTEQILYLIILILALPINNPNSVPDNNDANLYSSSILAFNL
jgi:hypothetical protein